MAVVVTVAMIGTPEAATADYVCDGVDDDVEINAAAAQAAAAGGGTVQIAAGNYSTSQPITVLGDGVALEGASAGGTVITPASNWTAIQGAGGAEIAGVVSFVGVDDFAARHLTIKSGGKLMNGLIAIPTGASGAGEICTNGVFEGNTVHMEQGHTYSIWSMRSEGIQIIDNLVEGGATVARADGSQEGIEAYGGRDVLISGNTVSGIGNSAINLGGLAGQTPDCSVENITVIDNHISNCRVGVFISTTWGSANGPANARDILVENNVFTAMFETGFQIRNWTGDTGTPPEASNITIRNNDVQMLYSQASDFSPAAVWFFDATAAGETIRHDIVVEGNNFTTLLVSAVPGRFWLPQGYSPFVNFTSFSGVAFRDNDLDLTAASDSSRGIAAYSSDDLVVAGNHVHGSGVYPIEFYDTSGFSLDGNILSDWGRGTFYSGILVGQAGGTYSITRNELDQAGGGASPYLLNIYQSDPPASLADNLRVTDQDATLVGSPIENLTLAGSAVSGTGNGLGNLITGNAGNNMLHGGGGGGDVLVGLGGDDTYYTDVATTKVVEAAGAGNDKLYTSVSYVLDGNAAVEFLSTNSYAATTPIYLTGNGFNQTLVGNNGANALHGGGGVDVLIGLGGNDIYYTDVAATQVQEAVGGGNDQLYTSVSYALGSAEIELLSTSNAAATTAINLTGNSFNQTLVGNNGANALRGGSGVDVLVGLGGDDIYYIDVASTRTVEETGGGNDKIYVSVSYVLDAGLEIELLSTGSTAGTTAINLTGNAVGQILSGNNGVNFLDGKGGHDTLFGFGAADTFAFTSALGGGNVANIADFHTGVDKIALDDAVFSALGLGALPASAFVIGSTAHDADDRILYNSSNGGLYYDADGNGAGAAIMFATLNGVPALTASDLQVI
jgi:hypothetical protein